MLAFLEGGTVLVSGGEDTLVQAWLLASVLDVAADRSAHVRVEPMHSWWVAATVTPWRSGCCGVVQSTAWHHDCICPNNLQHMHSKRFYIVVLSLSGVPAQACLINTIELVHCKLQLYLRLTIACWADNRQL